MRFFLFSNFFLYSWSDLSATRFTTTPSKIFFSQKSFVSVSHFCDLVTVPRHAMTIKGKEGYKWWFILLYGNRLADSREKKMPEASLKGLSYFIQFPNPTLTQMGDGHFC